MEKIALGVARRLPLSRIDASPFFCRCRGHWRCPEPIESARVAWLVGQTENVKKPQCPRPFLVSGIGAASRQAINSNDEGKMASEKSSVVVLLLSVPEAAKRLGVCRRSLERLIADGVFPRPVKLGRSSRVPVTDVERFVETLTRERAS